MHKVSKAVTSGGKELGVIEFPSFDNIEEMTEKYGPEAVFKLAQRALDIDLVRVARDAMRGDKPKSVEEAQATVDSYRVGNRGGKATLKNFLGLLTEFGLAGELETMVKAQVMNQDEGLETAHTFLVERKQAGDLMK